MNVSVKGCWMSPVSDCQPLQGVVCPSPGVIWDSFDAGLIVSRNNVVILDALMDVSHCPIVDVVLTYLGSKLVETDSNSP